MSKDILGSLVRALVTVPESRLGLLKDLGHKLAGSDGAKWESQTKRFVRMEEIIWDGKKKSAENTEILRAEVDLDCDPDLPFSGASIKTHIRQGKALVEYRPDEDELYVDGKKVVPFLSERQMGGKVMKGYELQAEAEANNPINANLADFLYKNQEFIPKKFRDRVWFFWGTKFGDSDESLVARVLFWSSDWWNRHCRWLDRDWCDHSPSASLAS